MINGDKLSYLLNHGMSCQAIQKELDMGFTVDEIAAAAENIIADGGTLVDEPEDAGSEFAELDEFGSGSGETIPFPVEAFSQDMINYCMAASDNLQVSPDMTATAILAAVAICAQRKFMVNPKPGWLEPVNLYMVTVANPSERKSAVHDLITRPLKQYQKEENERRRPEVEAYQDKRDALLRQIDNLKKPPKGKAKGVPLESRMEQVRQLRQELEDLEQDAIDFISLIADDVTVEALASKMVANHETSALVSSEGGLFNTLSGLYTGGIVNIDLVLKAYSGDSVQVDRKGRPPEYLNHPTLSTMIMAQPIVVQAAMNNIEFGGRGLNARFLYSFPHSPIGSRAFNTPAIPQNVAAAYNDFIYRLLSLPDTEAPRIIRLSGHAFAALEQLHNILEPLLVDELEPMGDWAGKYLGTVVRIMGLLHIMDHAEAAHEIPVPDETVYRASNIGAYFLKNAKAAYQLSGVADGLAEKDAKYILKRLDENNITEISSRDLFNLCKGRTGMDTVEKMRPGLNILAARGYIRINAQDQGDKRKGRPRSARIILNPEYLKRRNI